MRNISDKSEHVTFPDKRAADEIMWQNTMEPDRPQMTI